MSRLNLDNMPFVFNRWRELYSELTDQEQQDFANACEAKFPEQQHHTHDNFDKLFASFQGRDIRVLEVGGWKGELAQHCLARFPNIKQWHNVEFCLNAALKTVTMPVADVYKVEVPKQFGWFRNANPQTEFDVFVSSHTIEHLSNGDLLHMMELFAPIKTVMLSAPLNESGQDWHNDLSTHKLTWGWHEVRIAMDSFGYSAIKIDDHCYLFKRR